MLLVFPPVAKACEPPAGIARLAGALRGNGVPCSLLDANLEGLLWILERPVTVADTWSRRAARNAAANVAALRDPTTFRSPGRYARAVSDLNRLLSLAAGAGGTPGLADYRHPSLSPLRSADLLAAAERPEEDPFHPYFGPRLTGLVESSPPRLIGFSLNYLSQALTCFAMIGFVRKRFPGIPIVLGGGLVTSWLHRHGWRNPFGGLVDHLIAGPGEEALLSLSGVQEPVRETSPDFAGLPVTGYLSPGFVLPYSAAGGCWWNRCSFCPERAEGNPYRPLPVSRAMAEIAALAAESRPALLHLLDNAVSPALLRALAASPPGVPWYGFARIGGDLADPGFCRELKRSGCVMLKIGLESGDQGVLDRLGKGIDLGTAARGLANLKEAGIAAYVYLLFGTPAETEAEARRTLDFVARHGEAIRFLNLAIFNMPAFGEEAERYGTEPFYEGDLSLYTGFRHPGGWDRGKVRRFLQREFTRHPVVAAILRNDPPVFTSNHAPFFCG